MISFLKKEEDGNGGGGFLGAGDIVFLLVVITVIAGFWWYFQSARKHSEELFQRCEALFEDKNWVDARSCYDSAQDLQYLSDSLDKLLYNRDEAIAAREDYEKQLANRLDSLADKNLTPLLYASLPNPDTLYFLDEERKARIREWTKTALQSQPADSSH